MINRGIDWPLPRAPSNVCACIMWSWLYRLLLKVVIIYINSRGFAPSPWEKRQKSLLHHSNRPQTDRELKIFCSKYRRVIYNVKLALYWYYTGWGEECKGKKTFDASQSFGFRVLKNNTPSTVQGLHLLTMNTSNGQKAQIMLEELKELYGTAFTTTIINLRAGEQKEEWFLRINPNGPLLPLFFLSSLSFFSSDFWPWEVTRRL